MTVQWHSPAVAHRAHTPPDKTRPTHTGRTTPVDGGAQPTHGSTHTDRLPAPVHTHVRLQDGTTSDRRTPTHSRARTSGARRVQGMRGRRARRLGRKQGHGSRIGCITRVRYCALFKLWVSYSWLRLWAEASLRRRRTPGSKQWLLREDMHDVLYCTLRIASLYDIDQPTN